MVKHYITAIIIGVQVSYMFIKNVFFLINTVIYSPDIFINKQKKILIRRIKNYKSA